MPPRRPKDQNQLAKLLVDQLTGSPEASPQDKPAKNPAAVALGRLGGLKGGKARAKKLSKEERQYIAAHAAEARWGKNLPTEEYTGTVKIGDLEFPCAVLSDGTRVLTETNFMERMGMYRSGALSVRRGAADETGARMPLYLAYKNLKPYVDKHLGDVHIRPLKYRTTRGLLAHGIPAAIIPKICDVWLDARKDGGLGSRQVEIAEKAEILIRGLAQVGIIALVDAATGFERDRAKDALAKILEAFIAKELRPWIRTFDGEFYMHLFRLRGLPYPPGTLKKPQYFGHLTNDIIYKRLAPGVLDELRKTTPRREDGRLLHHFHRKLTEDVGHPKLREHLASVITLQRVAKDWEHFVEMLDQSHPRYEDLKGQMPLDI